MFKARQVLFFLLLNSLLAAQIGIGTADVSPSEALKIGSKLDVEAGYRGLLIPRVALADPINSIAPFTVIPKGGLLLFNSDPAKEGFYYFTGKQNGSTVMWEPVFSEIILKEKVVPVRTENSVSTAGITQNSASGGAVAYDLNELSSVRSWVKIPGLGKTVTLSSAANNVSIMAEGIVQLNNTSYNECTSRKGNGECQTPGNYTDNVESQSFAVGVFVNGQLKSVRTYLIDGYKYNTCMSQIFNIKVNLENVATNTPLNMEIMAITRSKLDGQASQMTWASNASGCSSVNGFMGRGTMSVQTQNF